MRIKTKRKIAYFFFILPIILAAFFVFNCRCFAISPSVIINEIQTAGVSANDEFIELYNTSNDDIDLSSWSIQYRGGSGTTYNRKNFTKGSKIKSKGYFLISHNSFSGMATADMKHSSFSLSAAGGTIFLVNNQTLLADGDSVSIIDKVGYGITTDYETLPARSPSEGKSIERKNFQDTDNNNIDFNFSNTSTPQNSSNTENIDNEEIVEEEIEPDSEEVGAEINELNLQVEIKQDKEIFPKIYSNFDAVIFDKDGNKLQLNRKGKKYEYDCNIDKKQKCPTPILKFTWDFGDKHKSYLFSTKHKYEQEGIFNASLTIKGEKKKTIKNFIVSVGKIPHPEVKIIAVNANPVGSDTENETITLQNKSKKKINLIGWSIATGWKKLVNHPILKNFEIKAGKKKEITREFSKFTLNNKKSEIELRYPDGEVADSIKYNKKKNSISEGEIYIKEKKKWIWQNTKKDTKASSLINEIEIINQETVNNEQENTNDNIENAPDENIVSQPMFKRENKLALNNKNIFKIDLSNSTPRVLGAETVREVDGTYFFTPEYPQQEHFVVVFMKNILAIINTKINLVINFFSNKKTAF